MVITLRKLTQMRNTNDNEGNVDSEANKWKPTK